MFQRTAMFMGLLQCSVAHEATIQESSDVSSGYINATVFMGFLLLFMDWLRLKLATPDSSNTEKLVLGQSAEESISNPELSEEEKHVENGSTTERKGLESSGPEQIQTTKNLEIFLESKKNSCEEEIIEKENKKEEVEMFEEENVIETQETDKKMEKIDLKEEENTKEEVTVKKEEKVVVTVCLEVSTTLSTFNVEPEVPSQQQTEHLVPEYQEFFEEFNPLNMENCTTDQAQFYRPRFYSDPTGGVERWNTANVAPDKMMAETYVVGERTPERTPEMSHPMVPCNNPQELVMMQEPGQEMMYAGCLLAPQPKVNERKPMVFIGGVSASTSPMEVVHELKNQGFNVTVVPRIRYGVSFGFCPDLVLSSEEEVQRLLSMGRVWVKDRWIDIRPYIPKDDEETNENSSKTSASELPVLAENGDKVEDGQQAEKEVEKTTTKDESTVQEVHQNVFADTLTTSMSPPCTPIAPTMYFFDPISESHTPYYTPFMMPQVYYPPPEYFYGEMTSGGCQSSPMYIQPPVVQ